MSALSKKLQAEDIDGVFALLNRVAMPENQWRLVYDRNQEPVHFKTQVGQFKHYTVSIKDLHQNCDEGISDKFTVLQTFKDEKVDSSFEPFTLAKNDVIVSQFAEDYKKFFDPIIFDNIKKVSHLRKCAFRK